MATEPSRIQAMLDEPGCRLGLNCHGCGTLRLIPEGIKIGDIFQLVVCPRCKVAPLTLRLTKEGVKEVVH